MSRPLARYIRFYRYLYIQQDHRIDLNQQRAESSNVVLGIKGFVWVEVLVQKKHHDRNDRVQHCTAHNLAVDPDCPESRKDSQMGGRTHAGIIDCGTVLKSRNRNRHIPSTHSRDACQVWYRKEGEDGSRAASR